MRELVLVTGGAGFIGSHLVDELLSNDYRVRVLDNLSPQVHATASRPDYLDRRAELRVGDVRDPVAVRQALEGVQLVIHLAAAVGVGQSMYEIREYTEVNTVGTAVLLEELVRCRLGRLVVASSMSIYGEGRYRDRSGTLYDDVQRGMQELRRGQWEPQTDSAEALEPIPTPESKPPALASVYALSKYDQERLCLMVGSAYQIPTVALRFFNVYGPRQALSNPYTGVLAIFAARLLNGRPPVVFEDGRQCRDFVNVLDVARACRLALESPRASGNVINVGSGSAVSILEVAERLAEVLGRPNQPPEITQQCRVGDIRHCFADITRARELLGYEPTVTLERGLRELSRWLQAEQPPDRGETARRELEVRGLTL